MSNINNSSNYDTFNVLRVLVWTSIVLSYLFILLAVLPVRLFIVQTTITNHLDREIFVTPYGREKSTLITTVPLSFEFIGISNPFNKNISVEPNETVRLYHDSDVSILDGLLISTGDTLFTVTNDKQVEDSYSITNSLLTEIADSASSELIHYRISDFVGFAFQILFLLYAPLMTVIVLAKKSKAE